jgi:hypothetical protein
MPRVATLQSLLSRAQAELNLIKAVVVSEKSYLAHLNSYMSCCSLPAGR